MRKALITAAVVVAVVVVVVIAAGGGSDDRYLVRAIFDNGSFVVPGEDVRIAGANVGAIDSTTVTGPHEVADLKGGPHAVPGKAVVVLDITDPGFQDFKRDASCLIRPQSLIGERFIDCRPTMPRAPGSPTPPSLKTIPDGQPGAGQHLLPLENNGTTVDVDLINNLYRLPYAQRFRLIINELGAGFAGQGENLNEIIRRSNPALRDTDRLLKDLNGQRDSLAKLASDSEAIMRPLSRERTHVAGFIEGAGYSAQATAERSPELQAALQKFPTFLRQFRSTMASLKGFSDQALPVTQAFGKAAPSLTDATRTLTPFASASTVALRSLGDAGEASGPKFRQADPIIVKARDLARAGKRPLTNFARFLVTTKKTKGFEGLMDLIYNTTGSVNGFDKYGHFLRSVPLPNNCFDYIPNHLQTPSIGLTTCPTALFAPGGSASSAGISSTDWLQAQRQQEQRDRNGGTAPPDSASPGGALSTPPVTPPGPGPQLKGAKPLQSGKSAAGAIPAPAQRAAQRDLLDYLLGP